MISEGPSLDAEGTTQEAPVPLFPCSPISLDLEIVKGVESWVEPWVEPGWSQRWSGYTVTPKQAHSTN